MAHFDRFQSVDLVKKTNILSETIHKEGKALLRSNVYSSPPKFVVNPFNKSSSHFLTDNISRSNVSQGESKEFLESIARHTDPPEAKSQAPLTSNQEIGFWIRHPRALPLINRPLAPLHYSDVVQYKSIYWKYHPEKPSKILK